MSENGVNSAKSASKEGGKGEESVKSASKGAQNGKMILITYNGIPIESEFYKLWWQSKNISYQFTKQQVSWIRFLDMERLSNPRDKWQREYECCFESVSDER